MNWKNKWPAVSASLRLIDLHLTIRKDAFPDLPDNQLHGIGGHAAPVAQGLP